MKRLRRLLVIEDDPADYLLLRRMLRQHGMDAECRHVLSNDELDAALHEAWDLVLSDYKVPGMEFRDTLRAVRAHAPRLPVILVSGSVGEETAVELLREGLSDFVLKDRMARLVPAVIRALDEADLAQAREAAEQALRESQAAMVEEQRRARLAALSLMEEAVAARDRAEAAIQALRDNESRFRAFFEHNISSMLLIEPDNGKIVAANHAAAKFYGHSLAALTQLRIADLSTLSQEHLVETGRLALNRERNYLSSRHRLADGSLRDVDVYSTPIETGGRVLFLAIVHDVTERRRTEEQLRKLSLAVEQSPECIVITDLQARIEYVNDAFQQISGYAREEVLGRNPRLLQSGRTPPETFRDMWQVLRAGKPWKGEFSNRRKDGSEYVEFAIVTPLRQSDGEISHYVAVKADITEKKRLGEELDRHRHHLQELVVQRTAELEAAKDAAEAANRTKSAFLANMSHEIRTPMNAIIGLSHLLRRDVSDELAQSRLRKIEDAAHHLMAIVNDVLDLSKIEAGRLTLAVDDFDIEDVARSVCAMVAEQIEHKGLELLVDLGRLPAILRGGRKLRGDSLRLSQALMNYLSNAVKFTDSGRITVRAHAIGAGESGKLVCFEVCDTGLGIAPQNLLRLFSPFVQEDASTTRRFGGTGLGLAITRHLARLMGGDAGASSTPGVGSKFWFTARLEDGGAVAAIGHGELVGRRTLVLHPDPTTLSVLCNMLDALQITTARTDDGEGALRALAQADAAEQAFDFVLVCQQRQYPDGVAIVRRIAATRLASPPRCVIVLDQDSAGLREAARNLGVISVLGKPLLPSTLANALMQALNKSNLCAGPAPGSTAEQTLLARYAGARLMLAEDNPVNREVALDLLREVGLCVDVAENGAQALAMAREVSYDLILMDLQMPELDGIAASRAIRELPGCAGVPILAMTANAFAEDRERCLAVGMNDHVSKPVDPEVLFSALVKWLPAPSATATPGVAAAVTPDEALRERLGAVVGLDLAHGLKMARGRPARLLRLLRLFADGHRHDNDRLRELLSAGNHAEAAHLAHSLKGAAGTIGLRSVQQPATVLDAALQDGAASDAKAAGEALCAALSDTVGAIDALPALAAVSDIPGEIDARAAAVLDRLEDLLSAADFGAGQLCTSAADTLQRVLGSDALSIAELIRRYDYDEALQRIRALRSARAGNSAQRAVGLGSGQGA